MEQIQISEDEYIGLLSEVDEIDEDSLIKTNYFSGADEAQEEK